MRFDDAIAELDGRQPNRLVPDLDRIRGVADLLDHPERRYPAIHITGTNGKTSTARLAGRMLCSHGLATGVYTSPHLASVTERIALCDEPIAEPEFAETYAHLLPVLEEVEREAADRVTYFETLTALAYLWFADKPVDAGVFEVGMGGTWDATNLVDGRVAVVCEIGLDHPQLGSTVEEVAREKSGIIKPGAVAVVQRQRPEAMAVLEARAAAVGAEVRLEGRDFAAADRELGVGGQRLRIEGLQGEYAGLLLPLHGEHQARNAACAVAACEALLGRDLSPDALLEALGGATSPGRMEVVKRHPLVVLDGAHNPDGAEALAAALGETFVWRRLHLVIGVLRDKDVDGIVGALASRADVGYATASSSDRALEAEAMAAACLRAGVPATPHRSVADALGAAEAAAGENDLIVVTGSLYTVADARRRYVED
ncbi:MAG TPA: Mur ligase family protein [Actinomycetota bacterium]|nr:Mur ligase family protein [Actinomycetota bacterium]